KIKDKNGKMKYPQKKIDDNKDSRDKIHKTTKYKYDRIMPNGHIGHNKFLVYVDKNNVPKAVLLGSTNWTSTGLCTQTNNTMIVEDSKLAKRYLEYWKKLKKDTQDAKGVSKSLQGEELRAW